MTQGLTCAHVSPGAAHMGCERRELIRCLLMEGELRGSPPLLGGFSADGGTLLCVTAGQEILLSSYRSF